MLSTYYSTCKRLFTYVSSEHPYVSHCRRYLADACRDPLFSAPHLKGFLEYLSEYSSQWLPAPYTNDKPFYWSYPCLVTGDLQLSSDTKSKSFDTLGRAARDYENPELLFLSGCPSPGWLNFIGDKYKVDMHFFQQHLSSIRPSVHVDVYAEPSLPSSSGHVLKLTIPTIGYLGDLGDSLGDMSRTRSLLVEGLRKQVLNNALNHPVGQAIIRNVYLHNREHFTLLQEVSICLLREKSAWTGTAFPTIAYVGR